MEDKQVRFFEDILLLRACNKLTDDFNRIDRCFDSDFITYRVAILSVIHDLKILRIIAGNSSSYVSECFLYLYNLFVALSEVSDSDIYEMDSRYLKTMLNMYITTVNLMLKNHELSNTAYEYQHPLDVFAELSF